MPVASTRPDQNPMQKPKGNGQPIRTRGPLANGRAVEGVVEGSIGNQKHKPHFPSWRECRFLLSPPLYAPLKPIKFCGSKPQISLNRGAQAPHRAGFWPVLLHKTRKNATKAAFVSGFFFPRKKSTHRPPELTKFPMPAVRHENKKRNPAIFSVRISCGVLPPGLRLGVWVCRFKQLRAYINSSFPYQTRKLRKAEITSERQK